MKSKTIRKVLKAKLNDWIKTIKNDEVQELVKKNTIITGGAIANMLLKEPVKDYDIYFKNKETTLAVANYYVDQFNILNPNRKNRIGKEVQAYVLDCDNGEQVKKDRAECKGAGHLLNLTPGRVKIVVRSDGVAAENPEVLNESFEDAVEALSAADEVPQDSIEKKENYRPVFLSSNAITLSDKVQLVVRFYGEPEEIHKSYDFVHCTNWYDLGKDELVLKPQALECLLSKELIYQGSKYPLCSIIRTRKFINRGFTINAGQYLKMCFQLNQLDLTNLDVLEDQLVGVDSAYFNMFISALKSKVEADPNFKVDTSYVATIVDRLF